MHQKYLFILGFFYNKNIIEHHLKTVTAPYVKLNIWISLKCIFEVSTSAPLLFCVTSRHSSKVKTKLLEYGLLFTNDFFGDGRDRWRTGSLVSSRVFGRSEITRTWRRREALNELRLFSQIIAPSDLSRNPDRSDAGETASLMEDIDRLMWAICRLVCTVTFKRAAWPIILG